MTQLKNVLLDNRPSFMLQKRKKGKNFKKGKS